MPTTYSGNPLATQAPGGQPQPGGAPAVSLPADGDAANAASIAQAHKEAMDWIAWLSQPTAILGALTQMTMVYKNARNQSRFLVDHMGFDAGKILRWQEDWNDVGFTTKSSVANGAYAKRWMYTLAGGAAGAIAANPPQAMGSGNPWPRSTAISLSTAATGTSSTAHLETFNQPIAFGADTALVMQWDFALWNDPSPGTGEIAMGFSTVSMQGGNTPISTLTPSGAALIRRSTDVNWQAYTNDAGPPVYTNSGQSGVTNHRRARLELVGANVSDDGAERALFYLDGPLVANKVINLTGGGGGLLGVPVYPFFRATNTAQLTTLAIGVVDFRANLWPGSVTT